MKPAGKPPTYLKTTKEYQEYCVKRLERRKGRALPVPRAGQMAPKMSVERVR
jgi:hypothetical protein